MATTIRELAELCGAAIVGGNPQKTIDSAANLDEAGAQQLTFLGSPKYAAKLKTTSASAVLVPKGTPGDGVQAGTCLLVVDDPEMAFIACLHRLYPQKVSSGTLSAKADIDPALEARIREELRAKGRSTPVFEFGFYRADGVLCTHVTNTVAIRPKGYNAQKGAYTLSGKPE